MERAALIHNVGAAGKTTEMWESCDGSRVLVMPYGGRVLGLFAPDDEENFFWTHAALREAATAKSFYASEEWHNSGGDRTWLAPEIDFFLPNYPTLDRYWQQRELDPASYQASRLDGALRWSTRAALTMSRSKQRTEVELGKQLSPAPNPLRHDLHQDWAKVRFAGFTLTVSLQVIGEAVPPGIGIWQLLQMPHGGEMLVPTTSRSEPKIYMGEVAADDLVVETQLVRYRMRALGEHKLAIRAATLTGRVGYLWGGADDTSLVIRNFRVNPSAEYVDVPWLEPENLGYGFQACNVNSRLGAFSELEHHVPAIGSKSRRLLSEDESQVWAFRGPEAPVRAIARFLLSAMA